MNLLFITKYLNGDLISLIRELYIAMIPFFAVLLAIIVDWIFGLYKSKSLGEIPTSHGMRRSVRKFIEYFSMLILAFIIDILASISENYNLPYVTFVAAGYLVFTEILSIMEKADDKERRRRIKDVNSILTILKDGGFIPEVFSEVVKNRMDPEQNQEKEKEAKDETDK